MRGGTCALCCVFTSRHHFIDNLFLNLTNLWATSFLVMTGGKGCARCHECTDLNTCCRTVHCCTRLHEAFSRAITLIPLFTSIFLINRTEPDEIMVLLPTQGLTGSFWGDNWVRRQQPCSWINCCTELLNSLCLQTIKCLRGADQLKPFKFKCPCLAESFSGSNDLPPFTSIYNRHIRAHHSFSPKERVFHLCLSFITAWHFHTSHVSTLQPFVGPGLI